MSQISNFESPDKGRNVSNKTWLTVIASILRAAAPVCFKDIKNL